jgi:PAS domain S-box-containing protein
MESKVHNAEELYRSLVNGARDSIFSLSTGGLILSLNPAFENMTGWERSDWLDKPFPPILHPDDRHRALEIFRHTLEGKLSPSFELRVLCRGGDFLPMEFKVTPQRVENRIIGVLGIGRDIRDRQLLEDQLRRVERLESVGHLAAGVAQDFNNLLTVQQGHLSLLLMDKTLPQSVQDSLRQIQGSMEQGTALVQQLLMIGQKQVLQPESMDLHGVIGLVRHKLGASFGESVGWELDFDQDLPRIWADPVQVEQVLINLVLNARDAMPAGGGILLRTRKEGVNDEPSSTHPEARPGRFCRLTVADAGVGMSEEILQRIFEPFFTTKTVGESMGLGLATARGIVRKHGGWVEVESQLGKGTQIHVLWPIGGEVATEPPSVVSDLENSSTETHSKELGGETLLVVEDQEAVRNLVEQVLAHYGYKVFSANNGMEALKIWEKHGDHIDLLFTDLVMPENLTGMKLVELLREKRPSLKVIITSGYSAELADQKSLNNDNLRFLQKPYSASKLVEVLRDLLDS